MFKVCNPFSLCVANRENYVLGVDKFCNVENQRLSRLTFFLTGQKSFSHTEGGNHPTRVSRNASVDGGSAKSRSTFKYPPQILCYRENSEHFTEHSKWYILLDLDLKHTNSSSNYSYGQIFNFSYPFDKSIQYQYQSYLFRI